MRPVLLIWLAIVPLAAAQSCTSALWPLPSSVECLQCGKNVSVSSTWQLKLEVPTKVEPVMTAAWSRYRSLIFYRGSPSHSSSESRLVISIAEDWTFPLPDVNESYTLAFDGLTGSASIHAESYLGALHALEALSQVVEWTPYELYYVRCAKVDIQDMPRFAYRGIMIDTARHFLPSPFILTILDAMSYHRFNVLHWHVTDQQSFPLFVPSFPNLTKGAYSPELVYSSEDVMMIVAYAAARGIRVIPEIDSPSHATSWAAAFPDIVLTKCNSLDPTNPQTYEVISQVLGDVMNMFGDPVVHVGGDEIDLSCWNDTTTVQQWLQQHDYPANSSDPLGLHMLAGHYITQVHDIIRARGRVPMFWQEAFDHYGSSSASPTPPQSGLSNETIAEIWLSPVWNWANLSDFVSGSGYPGQGAWAHPYRAVVTLGWYLDNPNKINLWEDAYVVEPLTNTTLDDDGNSICKCPEGPWRDGQCHCYTIKDLLQVSRVLGGEAAVWGEHISSHNWMVRAFPRASAIAERLWSPEDTRNVTSAALRLQRHLCRLIRRNISYTPLGPGACV